MRQMVVGAGRNDVEFLNTRNCLFGIEDGARTTTRQAPPQVPGDGDDGEGGGAQPLRRDTRRWWHSEHLL